MRWGNSDVRNSLIDTTGFHRKDQIMIGKRVS